MSTRAGSLERDLARMKPRKRSSLDVERQAVDVHVDVVDQNLTVEEIHCAGAETSNVNVLIWPRMSGGSGR